MQRKIPTFCGLGSRDVIGQQIQCGRHDVPDYAHLKIASAGVQERAALISLVDKLYSAISRPCGGILGHAYRLAPARTGPQVGDSAGCRAHYLTALVVCLLDSQGKFAVGCACQPICAEMIVVRGYWQCVVKVQSRSPESMLAV